MNLEDNHKAAPSNIGDATNILNHLQDKAIEHRELIERILKKEGVEFADFAASCGSMMELLIDLELLENLGIEAASSSQGAS